MELYYRRVETVRKGRTIPARTQTVVIFLPDVRSCLPTRLEWDDLSIKYKKHLEMKKQNNDGEIGDGDKIKQSKSDELVNNSSNKTDVDMIADEVKNTENETINDGDNQNQNKQTDSTEAKIITESESTNAAAILKALLIIIFNFT